MVVKTRIRIEMIFFVFVLMFTLGGHYQNILSLTGKSGEMELSLSYGKNKKDLEVCYHFPELLSPSDKKKTCIKPASHGSISKWYDGPYQSYIYKFVFTNLPFDTKIEYWIESKGKLSSEYFHFRIQNRDEKSDCYSFLAVGDGGIEHEPYKYFLEEMVPHYRETVDFMIFPGDFAFNNKEARKWDNQFTKSESLNAFLPVIYVTGNHEKTSFCKSRLPSTELAKNSGSPSNLYFSFDYGNIHFIGLSTEIDHKSTSPQYKWLENDLRKLENQGSTDITIVFFHKAMKHTNTHHQSDAVEMNGVFDALFHKYHVSITITAHVHHFERSCVIDTKGNCIETRYDNSSRTYFVDKEAEGMVHIVSGMLGRKLHTSIKKGEPKPRFDTSINRIFSHGVLEVHNDMKDKTLTFRLVSTSEKTRGEELDRFFVKYGSTSTEAEILINGPEYETIVRDGGCRVLIKLTIFLLFF